MAGAANQSFQPERTRVHESLGIELPFQAGQRRPGRGRQGFAVGEGTAGFKARVPTPGRITPPPALRALRREFSAFGGGMWAGLEPIKGYPGNARKNDH